MNASSQPDEALDVSCFVIGPIGNKHAEIGSQERTTYEEAIEVLEEVIVPACAGFGINPIRADQVIRAGEIPEQVFRAMRDAHLVIADLTGANANVMYELGLRHTTGKLTVQIGEYGRLPFDVASIRTILFRRTPGGLIEARRNLAASIADGLARGGDPVAATRVWFEVLNPAPPLPEREQITASFEDEDKDGDEPGFLEKLAATSEGLSSLFLSLDALTAVMADINKLTHESTEEMKGVMASGGDAGARLAVANRHAQKLEAPAGRLEVLVGDYRQSVVRIHPGMLYAVAQAKMHIVTNDVQAADARAFLDQVRAFVTATDETWPVLQAFRATVLESGNAARSLRRIGRRIAAALQQQNDTATYFDEWRRYLGQIGA